MALTPEQEKELDEMAKRFEETKGEAEADPGKGGNK